MFTEHVSVHASLIRAVARFYYLIIKMQVQNCYKIKKDVSHGAKTVTATPKPKDIRPRQSQTTTSYLGDTVEEAAVAAAYKVAEAENKSFVAAEAVKEAERVAKMAEDADSYLQLAKEIFEKCNDTHAPILFLFYVLFPLLR